MGDRSQIFKRVALFLERVVGRRGSLELDLRRFHLKGLLGPRGELDDAGADEGGAYVLLYRFGVVVKLVGLENDLEVREEGAVVEGQKTEAVACPDRSCPARDRDLFSREK